MKKIFGGLDTLEADLPEKYLPFVYTLRAIHALDVGVSGKKLDPNYSALINDFTKSWDVLKKRFGVSEPNKCHIISCHLETYFSMTGNALGTTSDQIVEASHQLVNRRFVTSNYVVKDVHQAAYAEKFHRGIMHYNL